MQTHVERLQTAVLELRAGQVLFEERYGKIEEEVRDADNSMKEVDELFRNQSNDIAKTERRAKDLELQTTRRRISRKRIECEAALQANERLEKALDAKEGLKTSSAAQSVCWNFSISNT